MNDLILFSINPDEVVEKLHTCNLGRYENPREYDPVLKRWVYPTDWAFRENTAIPLLYRYVAENDRHWTPDRLKNYLIHLRTQQPIFPPQGRSETDIEKRANKLVLDFCRELHTYGLLSICRKLAHVKYEKIKDVQRNVDYTACLSKKRELFGVQASMRNNWNDQQFDRMKRRRRNCYVDNMPFTGPLFFLTNKDIPGKRCAKTGTWLFTDDHIENLVEEIKSEVGNDMDVEEIGIKKQLEIKF